MALLRTIVGLAPLAMTASLIAVATAHADPVDMEPKAFTKSTRDGLRLEIRIDAEKVNSVPNLAAAANSREAFVSFDATATAVGDSGAITDSLFIAGYQLGCQVDVSTGLQLGGTAGIAPSVGVGLPTAVSAGVSGGVAGFVQTVLQPGVIVDLPLANMALSKGGTGMLDVDNLHIKADACGGDVTIRSYAYLRVSTSTAHTNFAAYGDPIRI